MYEFRLDIHSSPITCFGFEEETLLLCSCSDEHVFLSKWDLLLGHWDTKGISEDDGRILSCSIAYKGLAIYLTLFKLDTLLVYKVISAHHPTERGPLILDSIECFASLEKVKELTSWSRGLFIQNSLYIVGVASGNTVSLKLWQVTANKDQNQIKLTNHRMVSNMKTAVGADVIYDNNTWFVFIVGADGASEVFSISDDSLNLLYRFKIEEPLDASSQTTVGSNNALNTTMTGLQVDSRILCANFFPIKLPVSCADTSKNSSGYDMGGDGDAKMCAPFNELEKLSDTGKESLFGRDPQVPNLGSVLCPKLLIAAATTKGVTVIDVVSGQLEMSLSYGELLKDDTILIQYAQMCVNADSKEIILGLQSCLTRIVFSRRFTVSFDSVENETVSTETPSLIPSQPLSSKSVLRKKIKSPPRQPISYPTIKCSKVGLSRSPGNTPAWARSRSRPQAKMSSSRTKFTPPLSARSQSTASGSSRSLLNLVASTDCRTTVVDWQNSKELLSFEFSSKFNEHVHSQFYFMDKFIVQPEENKVVLYSYARRDNGYIKLKAGEFQLSGQNITALGAANQFYSNMIITGLSNKTIQMFDTNAETVSLTIPNAHSKPISCIRINEAPKGEHANSLCDIFMTSSFSNVDPIKLWDIRCAKCIMRISDVNQATFVPTSRPNISPCGRYIVSGFEDCSVNFYDVRKVTNRLHSFKKLGSTVLDCLFDNNYPMIWSGCRNGSILNLHIP
ncbi:WD repeat-containing protein 27 [Orchesella cincta]|uniref:WD repeat-containing protein 27 n=1 Tax=Orchesella cincta TaxID=48709 RepID=A0A1D2N648_ORCCI|nr:WD repeat-containing protein 27 [Orchesella cincta]